jgi:hypothetical protein
MSIVRNGMPASQLHGISWVKSKRSGPTGGNCVEIAFLHSGEVAMRNSRHPDGPALIFTAAEWDAFLGGAADGEFGRRPASRRPRT